MIGKMMGTTKMTMIPQENHRAVMSTTQKRVTNHGVVMDTAPRKVQLLPQTRLKHHGMEMGMIHTHQHFTQPCMMDHGMAMGTSDQKMVDQQAMRRYALVQKSLHAAINQHRGVILTRMESVSRWAVREKLALLIPMTFRRERVYSQCL